MVEQHIYVFTSESLGYITKMKVVHTFSVERGWSGSNEHTYIQGCKHSIHIYTEDSHYHYMYGV
jgi:hypothetical protein